MIPDYQKFIYFQDKRAILFFYALIFIVLGFYWKNNDYELTQNNAWSVSAVLAIMLFHIIYDLKASWAYSCVLGRVDVDRFNGKRCHPVLNVVSRPIMLSALSLAVFWTVVNVCLLSSAKFYPMLYLYLISPFAIYLVFRWVRPLYIRQVLTAVAPGVKYRHMYQYVMCYLCSVTVLNLISVSPLAASADFSLREGFFSARLMVAMLILCTIVLAINLLFTRLSKRYVFLGRIFLKEIDFYFSTSIPLNTFSMMPFIIRLLIVEWVLLLWIILVSSGLNLLQWQPGFELYFFLCFLPCMGYYFLHTWWKWHHEFMMACDMYFRYDVFNKRTL